MGREPHGALQRMGPERAFISLNPGEGSRGDHVLHGGETLEAQTRMGEAILRDIEGGLQGALAHETHETPRALGP